jgi:serine/threonine protein kinase/Tol biopolymer transport system component
MKPDEWRQIERIYLEALERPSERRPAFLAEACGGNDAIRREVESLLVYETELDQFLETPPGDFAARAVIRGQAAVMAGRTLGHYRMQSLLGVGGMGEIYLAHDLSLNRQVAIKLLPERFTQDQERLRRFVREARAASALNHPNILTIYEIGQSGDTHYIVTEYVEGETLWRRMKRQPLSVRDAVGVAIQIASALEAAHKTGIIHRDIKSDNLMLRPDGLVKVLDFGLAKLTEVPADASSVTLAEQAHAPVSDTTEPGMVMGTPRYMSPEQVRGQKVDARSDIFSLGVVLYETLAGRPPFDGETASDVIAAILKTDPLPLKSASPLIPGELELIAGKALRKDRETRYQTMRELQLDLTEFQERLDFEARLAGAPREDSGGNSRRSSPRDGAGYDTAQRPIADTVEIVAPDTGQSAKYTSGGPKSFWHGRRGKGAALAAAFALACILIFVWPRFVNRPGQPAPPADLLISKLTNTGQAVRTAISPDGKYVVYALDEGGRQSLRLRQVATGSESQIIAPGDIVYHGITFSPDGNFIYFVRLEPAGVLYRAKVLGDSVQKLLDGVDSPITFSPTGRQFAFVRQDNVAGEYALMVANEDGTAEMKLAARKPPDMYRLEGPAWSPDGARIACGVLNASGGIHNSVAGVRLADRVEEPLTNRRWERVEQVGWLADGSLLIVAVEARASLSQLWRLTPSSGDARRIVYDLSNYASLSLTADSSRLVTVRTDRFVNLWIAPGREAATARQITRGAQNEDGWRGLVWTLDGKLVYRSLTGGAGNPNIRIVNADGAGGRQLSADENQNLDPAITPDGRGIVWSAGRGNRNLWRMDFDGGNRRQLTAGAGEWFPQYTPDGKWLIYQAQGSGPTERLIYKMPADGGAPVQLTDKPSYAPAISPDGRLIACNYRSAPNAPLQIAVIRLEGGPPIHLFDPQPGPKSADMLDPLRRLIRWTPDGRGIAFIVTRGDVSNLWSQPLAGGPPKPLTYFTEYRIFNFAWSHDGRQLALSRGTDNSEVVLIGNFK